MSKSVVPAAAVAHAKQLVRNKKLTKRTTGQDKAQDEAQAAGHKDDSANVAQAQSVEQQLLAMADGSLGGFSFANALSSAASSTASLAAESGAQDDSGRDDDDDGSGTLLLIAAIGLVGAGIAVLAAGGGEKNKAPTVSAATQAITTNEDTAIAVTVAATDANRKDVLSYSVTTAPTKGAVSGGAAGAFTYTPNANANGADSFVVTVNDGKGGTVTQTVNVTITAVNDAPTIAIATQNLTGTEDTNVAGQTVAADIDSTALTYSVDSKAANGTVTVDAAGKFTYVPNANYNGADSFKIKASDGALSATQTVNVTLAAVNDAPTAAAKQDLTTAEDTTLSGQVVAADVDSTALTYAVGTKAANGTVTLAADGKFTYAPTADFNGADSFTVVVSDGALSVTQTVNVAVTAVNDAPVVTPASQSLTTDEDIAVNGALSASDIDSKDLTFAVGTKAANGSVAIGTDGKYTYTPNANFNGTDSFTLSVSDGDKSATQTVSVKINAVNDAPAVAPATQSLTTNEDTTVNGTLAATDVDSAALTYAVGTKAANGTVTIGADGKFSYAPNANANGTDTFTLTVSDGDKTTSQAVSVAIAAVNDAPTITSAPSALNVNGGATVNFSVAASDVDGDKLTTTTTVPGKGTVTTNNDGTFTYAPMAGFAGTDTFKINVSDGTTTTSQDVTVTVVSAINTFSIDIGQPSSDPTAVAAGTGKFLFTDDATKNTNVIIQSFTKDDSITVSGASAGLYNFGSINDTDVQITFNTNSANNIIILDNVIAPNTLVFDLPSAITAIGHNFITFA